MTSVIVPVFPPLIHVPEDTVTERIHHHAKPGTRCLITHVGLGEQGIAPMIIQPPGRNAMFAINGNRCYHCPGRT